MYTERPDFMPDWAWNQRYKILSKFDEARVDEGFYAMCPEYYALDIASRTPGRLILDACAGLGGFSIAFAHQNKQVIAAEINQERLKLMQHNAEVYGVSDKIRYHFGDVAAFDADIRPDTIAFDPPWGKGPGDYKNKRIINLEDLSLGQTDLRDIVTRIDCDNVVMRLPNNFNFQSLGTSLQDKVVEYKTGLFFDQGSPLFSCLFCTRDEFLEIPPL